MPTKTALVVVDVQVDFLEGGALAVPEGSAVVDPINRLIAEHALVVATQDFHPRGHASFATSHPGRRAFEMIDLDGVAQTLWPDHCVEGSEGAAFASGLHAHRFAAVFRKGQDPRVDSYSGFFDNARRHDTGLAAWLRAQGVEALIVVGLATDYCVLHTVLDARALGFATTVHLTACRGVDLSPGDIDRAIERMRNAGADIIFDDEGRRSA